MKIKYDDEIDAVFFIFSNHKIVESEEISKGVVIDYDNDNQMTAIEILNFRSRKEEIELPINMKLAS